MNISDSSLRRNVATPWRLPAAPEGTIHPESVRRAYVNHYADLQRLKLKTVGVLLILGLIAHWWAQP